MYDELMASNVSTVNVSFRDDLLREIDEVARQESRSRSELLREAVRQYIDRKLRLKTIIESARSNADLLAQSVPFETRRHRIAQPHT